MRSFLLESITNREEAHKYLNALQQENLLYHPESDANEIVFVDVEVSELEKMLMNERMNEVFEYDSDPCAYVLKMIEPSQDSNDKKKCVIELIEKANRLAERHLSFVTFQKIPVSVREWHEKRATVNMEISARLLKFAQSI